MTRPHVPPALLREAKRLVEREPIIEAVVLFGSRARGDAHRASDYDLAIISTAPWHDVQTICEPLARTCRAVQIVPVQPAALRTYRNTCNRVERAVVVDGLPLAGSWRRPRHRREAANMDHNAFAERFISFISHADGAIREIARARRRRATGTNNGTFNAFRAGEHMSKAVLSLYGLTHRKIHGVHRLADQLRSARRGARDQDERNALADRIAGLNGQSRDLNQLDYAVDIFEPMDATDHRLKLAIELAERCFDLYAGKATAASRQPTNPPDAHARALAEIVEELRNAPESLHKHPNRAVLSTETNEAIDSLCNKAGGAEEAAKDRSATGKTGLVADDPAAQATAQAASSALYQLLDESLDGLTRSMLGAIYNTNTAPSVPDEIRREPWWKTGDACREISRYLQPRLESFVFPDGPNFDVAGNAIEEARPQLVEALHAIVWPHSEAGQNAAAHGIHRPLPPADDGYSGPAPQRSGSGFGC